jgi:hypothetical protein
MLIVMAKNLDVVDELNSRYVFEAQSFVDVHDSLLPSSLIAKELKLYSSELMRIPLDPPLTINGDVFSPQSDVEEDQFPESTSMKTKDDFCATWNLRPFDGEHFKGYKNCHWVACELTVGAELTRFALSKYRHIISDLRRINIIPIASNIVSYNDRVYATLLVPQSFCTRFEPHSGMEVTNNTPHSAAVMAPQQDNEMRQQQMTFSDQDTGYTYKIDDFVDDVRKSRDERIASYKDFLKRPIKLNSYKWQVGGDFDVDINAWDDYFGNNTRINNRISFFNILRGKMCVKFVVSGTGFHYGRILISYMPLHRFDDLSGFSSLDAANLVQQSQLPHIFINPTTQQGGQLCLPFFYHEDYVSVTSRDWLELGNLQCRSLTPLRHANGGTDDVTVTVFAWMEDVEVSIPTSVEAANLQPQSGFEPQSGDEIDEANMKGVISGPATKIAGIAGMLSSVPVIGPYASATSKVAAGTAMIAKAIGLSRPNITKAPDPFKPEATSSLAVTNVPDRSAKLTLDEKQELSIDPRISGLGPSDPLQISSIAQIESYYTKFTWARTNVVGDFLYNVRVQPTIWDESGAGGVLKHLTAVGYASLPFLYWTGTLKFRFQIVCSAYHKGRLRIVYDPNWLTLESGANGDDMITNYSHIIDIANTTDFTVTTTASQPTSLMGHLYPGQNSVTECFSTTQYAAKERYIGNGVIGIYVVNELTTPSNAANNDVQVMCYVSAGDDFQVFTPDDAIKDYSVESLGFGFEPQSGEMKADKIDDNEVDMPLQQMSKELGATTVSPNLNQIYTGERVVSLRSLLKRYTRYVVFPLVETVTINNIFTKTNMRLPAFPPYRGANGAALANLPTTATTTDNIVNMTWLHWVTLAFQGHRGSVRWKLVPLGQNGDTVRINVERGTSRDNKSNYIQRVQDFVDNGTTAAVVNDYFVYNQIAGALTPENLTDLSGGAISQGIVNNVMEVEVPYMHNFRFHPGKRITWNTPDRVRYGFDNVLNVEISFVKIPNLSNIFLEAYVAGGEDYTTYFFTGCPPLRYTPVLPLPIP